VDIFVNCSSFISKIVTCY